MSKTLATIQVIEYPDGMQQVYLNGNRVTEEQRKYILAMISVEVRA